jgi:hypothetical protein
MGKEKSDVLKPIYIGFMRIVTLNFKLFGKETKLGWKI